MNGPALDVAGQNQNLHDWLDGQTSRPKWPVVREVIAALLDALETQHRERGAHGAVSPFAISIDRLQPLHVELAPPRPDLPDAHAESLAPGYLAPELRVGEGAPTVASDMYGVAAIAYRMVTGRAPEAIALGQARSITGAASHLAGEDYPIEFLAAVDTTLASDLAGRLDIAAWRAHALPPPVDEASTRDLSPYTQSDVEGAGQRGKSVPSDHGGAFDPGLWRLLFGLAAGTALAGLIGVWLLGLVAGVVVPVTRTAAPNSASIVAPPSGASDIGKTVLQAPRPAAPAVTPPPPPGPADGVTEPARPAPSSTPEPAQPTHLRDCDACPEMIVIKPGTVRIRLVPPGATTPQEVSVTIGRAFAVGRFELTRAEFSAFAEATGFKPSPGCYVRRPDWRQDERLSWKSPGFAQDDRHPVTCLSFNDAQAYAGWLTQQTGKHYRLLSDAEWHLIARGADEPTDDGAGQCRFANGADETALSAEPKWNTARCRDGYHHTAPVGTFAPVGQGFGDLYGNLWEWVDSCAPDFSGPAVVFGTCAADAPRILRGGSWSSEPAMVSLDARILSAPHVRDQTIGVRIARDL